MALKIIPKKYKPTRHNKGTLSPAGKNRETEFPSIDHLILIANNKGAINSVRRVMKGWPEVELKDKGLESIFDSQTTGKIKQGIQKAMEEKNPISYSFRIDKGTKDRSWFAVRISPIINYGPVKEALITVENITGKKRAAGQKVHEQANLTEAIVEQSFEGIVAIDADLNFIVWNKAASDILGVPQPDTTLDKWHETFKLYYPDQKTPINQSDYPLIGALRTGENMREVEMYLKNSQKTKGKFLSVNTSPLKNEKGQIAGSIAVFRDVTELVKSRKKLKAAKKNLEKQVEKRTAELRKSNKELEQFAYIVSHDLKEPLRKINSFSQLLFRSESQNLSDEGKEYISFIQEDIQRMKKLIEKLLDYSRVSQEKMEKAPVNLNTVLSNVINDLEIPIMELKAGIILDELPTVQANETHMYQLFQNLLSNSLKYINTGIAPMIHIRSDDCINGMAEILVQDNGIGFENKYAQKIFAPFKRLHGKGKYKGTGIGLAICQKIVQACGGEISAKGELGKGACFRVKLPIIKS